MNLQGRKVAIFLADHYQDLEFWYPYYRMKEAGADVVVIGPKVGTFHGKHGMSGRADRAIGEVKPEDFDALIIPGGYAPDHMRRSPGMVRFVAALHEGGAVVAAICHGVWMLASAGILQGRTVTSFYSIEDDVRNAGAEWVDQEVVRDGNLITSRRPDDLPAFCRTIIEALA